MDDEIGSIDRCTLDGKGQTRIKSDSMLTTNSRIVLGKYISNYEYITTCRFCHKKKRHTIKTKLVT